MTPYNHLPGYLHRWTLFAFGRLHVRLHHILTPDATPYLHTHPFDYVSVVISGGYDEQVLVGGELVTKQHSLGSVIIRRSKTPHRISEVRPFTKTLFFALTPSNRSNQGWTLIPHPSVPIPEQYANFPDGLYLHDGAYRRRLNGMWYALRSTPTAAAECSKLSIHQNITTGDIHALDTTKQPVQ